MDKTNGNLDTGKSCSTGDRRFCEIQALLSCILVAFTPSYRETYAQQVARICERGKGPKLQKPKKPHCPGFSLG